MTPEQKQQKLIRLLEELSLWPTLIKKNRSFELAPFLHNCLSILSLLSENNYYVKYLAKNLKIIVRDYEYNSHDSLRDSFAEIDQALPLEQQGFKNLLDFIILENSLRISTQDMMLRIPEKNYEIVCIFQKLIHNYDAYEELKHQFDISSDKILLIMFFVAVKRIFNCYKIPEYLLLNSIKNWDHKLYELEVNNNLEDRDNIIIFLCSCYVNYEFLDKKTAEQLRILLEQAGLPTLKDFINFGFVSVC